MGGTVMTITGGGSTTVTGGGGGIELSDIPSGGDPEIAALRKLGVDVGEALDKITADDLYASFEDIPVLPVVRGAVDIPLTSVITPNADTTSFGSIETVTIPITIANPSGTPENGQTLRLRYKQDAIGGRAVTFGSQYKSTSQVNLATLPTGAGTRVVLVFEWDQPDSKWMAVGLTNWT